MKTQFTIYRIRAFVLRTINLVLCAVCIGGFTAVSGCNMRAEPPGICDGDFWACTVHPLLVNESDQTVTIRAQHGSGNDVFSLDPGERLSTCRSRYSGQWTMMSAKPDGEIPFKLQAAGSTETLSSVTCTLEHEYDQPAGACKDSHVVRVSNSLTLSCEDW